MSHNDRELRVLVLAPVGRDARLTRDLLANAGIQAECCADLAELCRRLHEGAGAVVVTEESLLRPEVRLLERELQSQAKWSDVPLIVLTGGRPGDAPIWRFTSALGAEANLTLLERPMRPWTMVSTVQSALRARRRQYEVRDYMEERQRAEASLRESEERLSQAVGVASLGIFEHDHRSDIIYFSPTLRRIWGWAGNEPITLPAILHRMPPEEREAVAARIQGAHDPTGDGIYALEHRIMRPGGEVQWVSVQSRTLFEGEGPARRPVRTVGAMLDITERKQAEEALAAALAKAEQASQAKDHFLAVLSHELRTPLTPVVTALAMLQNRPDFDEPARDSLEMIRRNVDMEARLIDDLLDVTRISRGKVELDRKPILLCQVIRRAVEVCLPDIEARRLEFGVDASGGPYIVDGDATRLQQVFWNLLRNAVKFTPQGGCVGIRCQRDDHTVRVEVNDSGEGIEPEALLRIFNAFEQAERNTTRQFGGLGLGLTISKAMVELHGGAIQAHSEGKGKGASFIVTLPLVLAKLHVDVAPAAPPPPTRAMRILLVEDHGDTAKVMRRLLSADGHEVEIAGDVATALEMAESKPFDLLLSDLGLPDASGLELIRELRRRGQELPGIALSGYGQEEDIQRSREAGFAIHLTKPTNPDRLVEAIAAVSRPAPAPA